MLFSVWILNTSCLRPVARPGAPMGALLLQRSENGAKPPCAGRRAATLASGTRELLHVLDQRLDSGFRHGVVQAGAHAAHRAVALEAIEACGLGTLEEVGIHRLVR